MISGAVRARLRAFFDYASVAIVVTLLTPLAIVVVDPSMAGPNLIGRIDGWLRPVMRDTQLLVIDGDAAMSVVALRSIKQRDCNFNRVEWYQGDRYGRNSFVGVARFLADSMVRDTGDHDLGAWRVALSPLLLTEASFADVIHDCGLPWETRTRFWDSGRPG